MSRVALLLPELEAGGAQRVMLLLARELIARGHAVDLVLLNAAGPLLDVIPNEARLVDLGARTHRNGQLISAMRSTLRLSSWLKDAQPDVLLSTITGANLVALLARKMADISLRVVIREAVTLKNVRSPLRLRAMCWLYPTADAVVALSPVMAAELAERVGVPIERIRVIPNPVDVAYVRRQAHISLNHPWLIDERLKVVISVGRLIPQKDCVTLLRAFSLLPADLPIRLLIVGDGPERPMLERLSIDMGISERLQFVGFDRNPWRWMARADLFVLSSRWEGCPNVLLEALVLGLPVVVSEYDMSINAIFSENPGYPRRVVPVGNTGEMATAIQEMCAAVRSREPLDYPIVGNGALDEYEQVLLFGASRNS